VTSRIEAKAELSVGRACAFGGIGICTFMIGMISEPHHALLMGAVLTLIACLVLVLRANLAPRKPYKRTEVWLLLDKSERPAATVAQQLIGSVLREVYLRFALYSAVLALGLLIASVLLRVLPASAAVDRGPASGPHLAYAAGSSRSATSRKSSPCIQSPTPTSANSSSASTGSARCGVSRARIPIWSSVP
jgi:hypothetical protein